MDYFVQKREIEVVASFFTEVDASKGKKRKKKKNHISFTLGLLFGCFRSSEVQFSCSESRWAFPAHDRRLSERRLRRPEENSLRVH